MINLKPSSNVNKLELPESEDQNILKLNPAPLYSKFLCWTCGLYLNEQEICFNCVKFNSWTSYKIENNGSNDK